MAFRARPRVVAGVGGGGNGGKNTKRKIRPYPSPHTIDVKAWPAGTYFLRDTTPMDTTIKKLLVR